MTGSAEEVLVELLADIERACHRDYQADLGIRQRGPLRLQVLDAAVTARTRLEKVRLGVVAA